MRIYKSIIRNAYQKILTCYIPQTSGEASVCGFDVNEESMEVRKRIGYLPETPPLYEDMTVTEYLYFVARIKGISGNKVKHAVDDAISRCFLGDVRNRLCHHISKGYRQRVGLAQAIIHDPEVIILDEPTSGLDPRQIIEIRQLIASLAKDHTVILSTHILPEVTMVCTRVVIINRGQIVLQDSLAELVKNKSLEQVFLDCVASDQATHAASTAG